MGDGGRSTGSGEARQAARWITACCLLALALALGLSACGGDSQEATAKAGTPAADSGGRGPTKPPPDAAPGVAGGAGAARPAQTTGGACKSQIGDFLGAMDKLRTNLVAGVSYEQYVGEVGSIRTVYRAIPVDDVALGCLRAAGTPGERGLNRYIEALDTWSGCVETPGCASESIEAALQGRWRQASKLLSQAQRGLHRLATG